MVHVIEEGGIVAPGCLRLLRGTGRGTLAPALPDKQGALFQLGLKLLNSLDHNPA